MRAWGIDLYQHDAIEAHHIKDIIDHGACFVLAKASTGYGKDKRTGFYEAITRDSGAYFGIYHWVDPTASVSDQANRFSECIYQYHPDFITADNEQWWSDWGKWMKAIQGKIPWSDVPHLTSKRISKTGKQFMDAIHANFPNLAFFNYTAKWFVSSHSPDMSSWIEDYPVWLANYIAEKYGDKWETWERFYALKDGLTRPLFPNKCTSWEMWQISSKWKFPGDFPEGYDTNIFNGTKEQFEAFINSDPLPPPEPPAFEWYEVTAVLPLRVRSGPGLEYTVVGHKYHGNQIPVFSIENGWAKINEEGTNYVSANWIKPV